MKKFLVVPDETYKRIVRLLVKRVLQEEKQKKGKPSQKKISGNLS